MDFEKIQQDLENKKTVMVYKLSGEFTPGTTLGNFQNDISTVLGEGCCNIILDFSQVYYVNSGGISELIRLRNKIASESGTLTIIDLNESIANVFFNMRLFKIFNYYSDIETALKNIAEIPSHSNG